MKVFLSLVIVSIIFGVYSQFFNDYGFNWYPNNFYANAQAPPGRRHPGRIRPGRGPRPSGFGGPRGPTTSEQYFQYNPAWSILEDQFRQLFTPHVHFERSAKHARPHRPKPEHFHNFYHIYNRLEADDAGVNKVIGTEDDDADSTNDDFDGRSIVAPGQYPHMVSKIEGSILNICKIHLCCNLYSINSLN